MNKLTTGYISIVLLFLLTSCGNLIDEKYAANLVKNKLYIPGNVTASVLKGGLSDSKIFRVTSESKNYVVRFLINKTLDERKIEIEALKRVSSSGYGPYIYYADIDKGVVIMEFLQNQNISEELRNSESLYILLANLLKNIHACHKTNLTDNNTKVFDDIYKDIQDLNNVSNQHIPLEKLLTITQIIQQAVTNHLTTALCHNDLNPNNILFLGNQFKAIDYEHAAQNEPYYDVATVAVFYCFRTSDEHLLLTRYLDKEPSAQAMSKLYLIEQLVWINYALAFLKMVPNILKQYQAVQVPSYWEIMEGIAEGKINLEDPENKLKYAKVLINNVISNSQTTEFNNAIKILNDK
ncbi:MAG: phosphotransferase [Candidatus Babeliales bacterium]|nr:phosphotransferase [Candidatus Babeliales bacterium]